MSAAAPNLRAARTQPLDRRRVYIFPTRHGFMLGAMTFVILLGSINYDNALGYLLTFLLFGLFLIAMLHTFRNLYGLTYLGAEAAPVFAGQTARFVLSLDNRDRWPRYSLDLAAWPRRTRWWRRRAPAAAVRASITEGAVARIALGVPSHTRGWLPLGRVRLATTFPLGILRAWAYVEDDARCLVYPQPLARLPLPLDAAAGTTATVGNDRGNDDFAGFRTYRPGDPIRAVAWKTLARQDTVLVKRFTSGIATRLVLRYADCAVLPDTEARLGQLTQWVLEADERGCTYGLELPGTRVEVAHGAAHRQRCLRELALFGP